MKKAKGIKEPLSLPEIILPSLKIPDMDTNTLKETALRFVASTKERTLIIQLLYERGTQKSANALFEISRGRWIQLSPSSHFKTRE